MNEALPQVWQQLVLIAISAGLGAILGIEREFTGPHAGGVRTFTLITLWGTLAAIIAERAGGWVVVVGLLAVVAYFVAGRFSSEGEHERGHTTEVAAALAYLVGALVWYGPLEVAVAAGFAIPALLYFKPELHEFARRLTRTDFLAILQFALVAFVILPILPDQGYGPWEVLNPRRIWLMVVLVVAVSLAGYVALKLLGTRKGLILSALLGGLVSSTATSISLARQQTEWKSAPEPMAAAILIANTSLYFRLLVLLWVVNRSVARLASLPLTILLLVGLFISWVLWLRAREKLNDSFTLPPVHNPTALGTALQFGVIFALVLILVAAAQHYMSGAGVAFATVLSSLTDLDAITLSLSELAGKGEILAQLAAELVVWATLVNLVFKFAVVFYFNRSSLTRLVGIGFGLLALATVATALLFRALL